MAGHIIIVAMATLLVVSPSSQQCTRDDLNSGKSTFPHPSYCELRLSCNLDLTYVTQACIYGLVFDQNILACTWPESANCSGWICGSTTVYPSVCDDSYFKCSAGGFVLERCPAGYIFSNFPDEPCVWKTDTEYSEMHQTYCARAPTVTPSTVPGSNQASEDATTPCELRRDTATYMKAAKNGDICSYDNFDPSNPSVSTFENRPCAVGTGFDTSTCRCVANDACKRSRTDIKSSDPMCLPTMELNFQDKYNVYAYSKSTGQRFLTRDRVEHPGVIISGSTAVFRRGFSNENPYLLMPRFNNNEMRSPWVFTITFRTDGSYQTFYLLRNEQDNTECQSTISAEASADGASLRVDVTAYAMTDLGISYSGSGAASIPYSGSAWVKLTLIMDQSQISGHLRSQTGDQGEFTPMYIGEKLKKTQCGFEFAYGLNGEVNEVTIHEGCENPSMVNLNPQ